MQEIVGELEALGATLVAITPQLVDNNLAMMERHSLSFDLLADPGNVYAATLGLRFTLSDAVREVYGTFNIDLPANNGEDSWTLPMPARLVVDSGGIIRAADIDPDYTRRPEPGKTIDDVTALG